MSTYYTIYQITNLINGKIYVGKHETKNLDDSYLGSGDLITDAIKKYGKKNFRKEYLFVFETYNEMEAKEIEIVDLNFVSRSDTYNIKVGGEGGWHHVNSRYLAEERKAWSSNGGKKAARNPKFREAAKQTGKRWVTNGLTNKLVYPERIPYLGSDWRKGRTSLKER